ncbi:class I SAM-dependent methyltransferase [Chloroflexota bacterium]
MSEKAYEEYFSTQYWGKWGSRVLVDEEYGDIIPDSRAANIFNDLKGYVRKETKIIEIGCGQGENLIVFKKNGFDNLTGLEPSPECCQRMQNFYDINCVNKALASYVLESNASEKFDCVMLSHVLDHFIEPEKAIGMISSIMEPEGIMYIRLKNFYGFSNPFSHFYWNHTFYFSQASLQMLLNNCGFEVDRYFESSVTEFVLTAKKSKERLIAITGSPIEYEKVISYLGKNRIRYYKLRYIRLRIQTIIMTILGKLILKVFGERVFLTVEGYWHKLRRYKSA